MSTYQIQDCILEQQERSLYHALTLVVAQRALILTKVKLSAILVPPTGLRQRSAGTHLDRYIVDFVLCDRQTTRPLLIIQQEATTEDGHRQSATNDVIERLVQGSGLPLVRLASPYAYRMDRLLHLIEPYLTDDKRGPDYERGDRLAQSTQSAGTEANQPVVPRPATLFSAN